MNHRSSYFFSLLQFVDRTLSASHQVMIVNFRYRITDEIDRCIVRRVLVYLGTISRATKLGSLVVHVRQNDGDFGGNRWRGHDFRHFSHGDLQDESAVGVLLRFSIELRPGEHQAGSRVYVEQISRPLGDAVYDFVVYSLVAVHCAHCNVYFAILIKNKFVTINCNDSDRNRTEERIS